MAAPAVLHTEWNGICGPCSPKERNHDQERFWRGRQGEKLFAVPSNGGLDADTHRLGTVRCVVLRTGQGGLGRCDARLGEPAQVRGCWMSGHEHLLIVGDTEETCLFLSELLEDMGCRFRVAGSRAEARSSIRKRAPQLVLLDFAMSRRASQRLLNEIRTDPEFRSIPVIGIAESSETERPAAWAESDHPARVDGVIELPIDPPSVAAEIGRLLPSLAERLSRPMR